MESSAVAGGRSFKESGDFSQRCSKEASGQVGVCLVGRQQSSKGCCGAAAQGSWAACAGISRAPHAKGSISSPKGETPSSLALSGHGVSCGGRKGYWGRGCSFQVSEPLRKQVRLSRGRRAGPGGRCALQQPGRPHRTAREAGPVQSLVSAVFAQIRRRAAALSLRLSPDLCATWGVRGADRGPTRGLAAPLPSPRAAAHVDPRARAGGGGHERAACARAAPRVYLKLGSRRPASGLFMSTRKQRGGGGGPRGRGRGRGRGAGGSHVTRGRGARRPAQPSRERRDHRCPRPGPRPRRRPGLRPGSTQTRGRSPTRPGPPPRTPDPDLTGRRP